jgi:sigma-B regulation protein RsbU (phosphoserine phosphatase)
MKKWLQKLRGILSSAFPTAASPYWRALPLQGMKGLLAGVFFITAVAGFAADLLELNVNTLGRGFFLPAFFGTGAVVGLVATIKRLRSPVLIFIVVCWIGGGLAGLGWLGLGWVTYTNSILVTPWPMPEAMKARIVFDAIGIIISGGLGFRFLLSFVTHEGLGNVRMQTELALAHGIQARLVPDISLQMPRFEVYGKSISSTEMGGDLIDIVENDDGSLFAYVADISGHGLPAGQLMGMLKTALRASLRFHQQPVALLESADRVLPAVKEADMYATLAMLYFDASSQAEYAVAGHLSILHYRYRSGDTVRLSMEQFPLGLIPGGRYASQRVSYSPGDMFLLVTDGITEVVNERDEEFGLARLEQLLSKLAAQPMSQIWQLVMGEVKQHGAQQDDQSLLLLRVRQ